MDLRSRDVTLRNINFKSDNERVWARFERQEFEAPIPLGEGLVTYEDYLTQK